MSIFTIVFAFLAFARHHHRDAGRDGQTPTGPHRGTPGAVSRPQPDARRNRALAAVQRALHQARAGAAGQLAHRSYGEEPPGRRPEQDQPRRPALRAQRQRPRGRQGDRRHRHRPGGPGPGRGDGRHEPSPQGGGTRLGFVLGRFLPDVWLNNKIKGGRKSCAWRCPTRSTC